jgi:CBS domain-containing protein
LDLRVDDVMNRKVITIDVGLSIKYAAKMMSYLRISSLVVLTNEKVVGILTERDIVSRVVAKGQDPEKVLVNDIMSQPVIIGRPMVPLENAVLFMIKQNIKKLPIMGGDNNEKLIGILSLTDVARLHPMIFEKLKEMAQNGSAPLKEEVGYYVR